VQIVVIVGEGVDHRLHARRGGGRKRKGGKKKRFLKDRLILSEKARSHHKARPLFLFPPSAQRKKEGPSGRGDLLLPRKRLAVNFGGTWRFPANGTFLFSARVQKIFFRQGKG